VCSAMAKVLRKGKCFVVALHCGCCVGAVLLRCGVMMHRENDGIQVEKWRTTGFKLKNKARVNGCVVLQGC